MGSRKLDKKVGNATEEVVNGTELNFTLKIEKNTNVMVKFVEQKDLPELKLTFLSIRENEVKEADLTKEEMPLSVYADDRGKIKAEDIVAKFTYGSVTTPEKI